MFLMSWNQAWITCVIFMLVNIKKLAVLEVTMTNTPIPVCKLHQDIFVDNIFGAFS